MNKKGFTLMELLAVIIILAIVSVSATISFGNIDTTTSTKELQNRYIEIQRAASLYVDLNDNETYLDELTDRTRECLNNDPSSCITRVSVGTLKANNYINDLSNPVTGDDIPLSSIVVLYVSEPKSVNDVTHVNTCILSSKNSDDGTYSEINECVANSKGEWLDMPIKDDQTLFDINTAGMTEQEKENYRKTFCCEGKVNYQ